MNSYARARAEAKALDAKAAKGEFVGPLHGVPMTIKDSLDTEGVISTGATYGRQQYIPTQGCDCRRARAQGGCDSSRQDEHARVHARRSWRHQHREQSAVRLVAQSLRPHAQHVRFVRRRRRHRCGGRRGVRHRFGLGRIDSRTIAQQWHRRHQADERARAAHRSHRRLRRHLRSVAAARADDAPRRRSCADHADHQRS